MKTTLLSLCLAGSIAPVFPQINAHGNAILSGKVIDGVVSTPLMGAVVQINYHGIAVDSVTTDRDGTYSVRGLIPHQEYLVTFSKDDYVPDIRTVVVSATQDGQLVQQHASAEYWKKKALLLKTEIASAPASKQADLFRQEWDRFRMSGVSSGGKAIVAKELNSSLDSSIWKQSKTFSIYANADPAQLDRVEHTARANPSDPTTFTIDPTIMHDIRSYQLDGMKNKEVIRMNRTPDSSANDRYHVSDVNNSSKANVNNSAISKPPQN